jgi:fibronectin-binding autotransporter adhesin
MKTNKSYLIQVHAEKVIHKGTSLRSFAALRKIFLVIPAIALSLAGTAQAQNTEQVVQNGSTNLGASATYSPSGTPTATSDVTWANITYSPTAFTTATALTTGTLDDLDTTQTLTVTGTNIISLNGGTDSVSGSTTTDLIYLAAGANLTLDNGNFTSTGLSVAAGTGNFDVGTGSVLTIDSTITGNPSITQIGGGTVILAGANTNSGSGRKYTLEAGTLDINSTTALGSANPALVLDASGGTATIDNTSASPITLTNNNAEIWDTSFTFTGTKSLSFGTGGVTGGTGARSVTVTVTDAATSTSGTLTINGAIINGTGALTVTKAGAGTLILGGANTYSGTTTISAGNLQLLAAAVGSTSSSTGTGNVALNGGTSATVSGTGQTLGTVTVTNGSHIAPGVNTAGTNFGSVGTLGLGMGTGNGLTLTNANLDYDLGTTNTVGQSDVITTGALTLGTLTFNLSGTSLQTGVEYDLINDTSETGGTSNITTNFLGSLTGAYTAQYSVGGGSNGDDLEVMFNTTAVPEPSTWAMLLGGLAMAVAYQRRRMAS